MRIDYLFLLGIGLFFIKSPINAQDKTKECYICKVGEIHHDHEPPYTNLSLKREGLVFGGALGLAAATLLINSPEPLSLEEVNLLDANDINRFDRYATSKNSGQARRLSDLFLTGVLVLPTIFLSNHHTRKDVLPLVVMSAETVLINLALTNFTKKIVRRTRPLAYNPNFSIEEKITENARLSFYSGHTSHTAALSFLIAKVMTDYHPHVKPGLKIGIWTFSAAIPALTGYLRVRGGKHFPSDTITGFIAGGLVGVLVPHFHKSAHHSKHNKLSIVPSLGLDVVGLTLKF